MSGLGVSYSGQIATLCRVPNQANGSFQETMSRRRYIMRAAVSSFKIGIPNFFIHEISGLEQGPGSAAMINAAIEYPSGTMTQVTFHGGNSTGTASDASVLYSDDISLSIPDGSAFWIRIFYQAAQIVFCATYAPGNVEDTANGDAMEYAASGLTDKTMSGTIGNTAGVGNGLVGFSAVAVIGQTTKPSVFIIGDSRGMGQADTPNDSTGDIGEIQRSTGPNYGYITSAISGCNMQAWLSNNLRQLQLSQWCSHIVSNYGINDVGTNGRTAAQLITDVRSARNFFGERPFIITTLYPETSSTDAWATLANQTTLAGDANRLSYNTSVRAGITDITGYLDVASILENTSKWIVNGTANYATQDGYHPTPTATGLVKTSGVISACSFRF
jgi:hypothetical protein